MLSYHETEIPDRNRDFTGRCYYVSINLRRVSNLDGYDSTPVLKIKVPYKYNNSGSLSDGMAKFTKLPVDVQNSYTQGTYGKLWNDNNVTATEEMIITKNMLPSKSVDNGNITISGYIDFDDNYPTGNHRLKEHNLAVPDGYIDLLNLEIYYLGGCDVEINWIKFESPNTKKLLNGYYDSDITSGIQADLDRLTAPEFRSKNVKPMRFIINVEGSPINWAAERHFSKLVGNIITGQSGAALPNHYDYYINPADKWYSYAKITPSVANPFCKPFNWNNNIPDWKTFGLKNGYFVKAYSGNPTNLFNSDWETYLNYDNGQSTKQLVLAARNESGITNYRAENHVRYYGGPISTQAYWEWNLHNNYVNKYKAGFQYSDIPWFPQTFVEGFIFPAPVNSTQNSYCPSHPNGTRVITGEEYRLMNWNPIILGCRGLMYDGDFDYPNQVKLVPNDSVLDARIPGYETNLTDMEFLNHPRIDPDFLDTNYNHISPTMGGLLNTVYKPDTVAKYMGTLPNRLFMGKRSVRLEMRKLHEWIRANESYIMSQRLQAWFGYGYKLWYKQKPGLALNNIMKKFVNTDSIKSRKIFDCDSSGYKTTPPNFESTYETFCDFTLLADTSDLNMNNKFTLGIQSRRTDPLIYFEEDSTDKHILFLSTAEYDDLCDNGGVNPMRPKKQSYPDTVWQKYKYKSFGTREITIPFNYCDASKPDEYVLLHVQELKADNAYDSTWSWWRQERYNNYVDTIIGQNSPLAVKFLPGEGKLFSCEILRPNPIQGDLAHSNQSKFIVFPEYNENNESTDMVRYHLTYQKPDPNRDLLLSSSF